MYGRREELSIDETAAALVDVGRLSGFPDEAQAAHLERLGLDAEAIGTAMRGTAGDYPLQNVESPEVFTQGGSER